MVQGGMVIAPGLRMGSMGQGERNGLFHEAQG